MQHEPRLREGLAPSTPEARPAGLQPPALYWLSASRAVGHHVAVGAPHDCAFAALLDASVASATGTTVFALACFGALLLLAPDALEEPVGAAIRLERAHVVGTGTLRSI